MIKVFCPRPGCGTSFSFGDGSTAEQVSNVVNAHVEAEHGTVESRHRDYIESSRDVFGLIAGRGRITPTEAKNLYNAASDLLKKPRLAMDDFDETTDADIPALREPVENKEAAAPAPAEEKKDDADGDASQAVHDSQGNIS